MNDDTVPATKKDISMIMEAIGDLYDANARWKDEIKDYFALSIETLKNDFFGVQGDRISAIDERTKNLDRRVTRLESRMAA